MLKPLETRANAKTAESIQGSGLSFSNSKMLIKIERRERGEKGRETCGCCAHRQNISTHFVCILILTKRTICDSIYINKLCHYLCVILYFNCQFFTPCFLDILKYLDKTMAFGNFFKIIWSGGVEGTGEPESSGSAQNILN